MNPALVDAYRRHRRTPYEGARHALYLARRELAGHRHDWNGWGDPATADLGTVDGCEVTATVRCTYEPADLDFLGTFTDDPDGAVPNPVWERGSYKYFRPEWSIEDRSDYYRRQHGMTRPVADAFALDAVAGDARMAATLTYYTVEVVARIGGADGYASMGFDASDDCDALALAEEVMGDDDLVADAVHEAWKSLARKLNLDARLYEEVPNR